MSVARKLVEPTSVSVFVEVKTVSEKNVREHFMTKSARVKAQREITTYKLRAAYVHCPFPAPLLVTLTRRGVRLLDDDDNLPRALSAIRDAFARWVGIDDRHRDQVRYRYRQELAKGRASGVDIRIEPMAACADCAGTGEQSGPDPYQPDCVACAGLGMVRKVVASG